MARIPKMPKLSKKVVGQYGAAALVAAVVAAALAYIAGHYYAFSAETIRDAALNVASLVVAYLLISGIGRGQKDKP
jgi:uncharacterized membrane protein